MTSPARRIAVQAARTDGAHRGVAALVPAFADGGKDERERARVREVAESIAGPNFNTASLRTRGEQLQARHVGDIRNAAANLDLKSVLSGRLDAT